MSVERIETESEEDDHSGLMIIPSGKDERVRSCDFPFSMIADDGITKSFSSPFSDAISFVPVTINSEDDTFPILAVIVVFPGLFGKRRRVFPSGAMVAIPLLSMDQSTVEPEYTVPSDAMIVAWTSCGDGLS